MWSVILSVLDGSSVELGRAFFLVSHAWLAGFGWAYKRYPAMMGVMGICDTAKLSWPH